MSPSFPQPEQLVPHRGDMLLIRKVVRFDSSECHCLVAIPGLHRCDGEGAPAILGVEALAQTCAVFEALTRRPIAKPVPSPDQEYDDDDNSRLRMGYLVGIRDAEFLEPFLPTDQPLLAKVSPHAAAGPLSIFHGSLHDLNNTEENLLTASLQTYRVT